MQPSSIEIEQIVRVVMQRLAAAGDLISGVGSIADTELSELVLRQRVITLASLEGQTLKGKQRLRVHPRAVVTPAVHDELRKFKVELVRECREPYQSGNCGQFNSEIRGRCETRIGRKVDGWSVERVGTDPGLRFGTLVRKFVAALMSQTSYGSAMR